MGPAFPISFHAGGAGGLEPIKLGMQDGMVARAANVVDDLKAVHGVKTMLAMTTCQEFMRNGITIASLLMSGILPRFPELRFISVESGVGWVPFVLESLDKHAAKYRIELEHPEFTEPPSFYFHRQVFANCWYEHLTDYHLEVIGEDNILFETDFPHPTCLIADEVASAVDVVTGSLPDEAREKILWKNACRVFKLDESFV